MINNCCSLGLAGKLPLIEGAQAKAREGKPKPQSIYIINRRPSSFSKKGQFMIITIVLVGLAFFSMYLMVRTVDRSSVVMFEQSELSGFESLHDAIVMRNAWVQSYWWDLNWDNRAEINVTSADTTGNILMVDPNIPSGTNCNNEVRVTDAGGVELKSNINLINSPCNVVFLAPSKTGTYYIYWNNPAATEPSYRVEIAAAGEVPSIYTVSKETSPKLKFCPHAAEIASASEKLDCEVQSLIGNNKINYKIDYSTPDASFSGYLS